MNKKIESAMFQLSNLIAERKYEEVARLCNGVRLGAADIAECIAEYGRTVVSPPLEASQMIDAVEVANAIPRQWSVQMPLWTREEGRSDLTLEVTLKERGNELEIEVDDLHVL